jgi:hypothetical protein
VVDPVKGPKEIRDTENQACLERLFRAFVIERKEERNERHPRNEKEVYSGVTKHEKQPRYEGRSIGYQIIK